MKIKFKYVAAVVLALLKDNLILCASMLLDIFILFVNSHLRYHTEKLEKITFLLRSTLFFLYIGSTLYIAYNVVN